MHNKIYMYEITCPECGSVHVGFIGDNEDGSFCCNSRVKVKKGNKEWTEECGCTIEKLHHIPEGSCKLIATIKIEDSKPVIDYL